MIDLSYGIKMRTEVFSTFVTIYAFDRQTYKRYGQTDGQTFRSWLRPDGSGKDCRLALVFFLDEIFYLYSQRLSTVNL